MRVLVTGGAGFIGSHIVARLVADSHKVSVIDDLSAGRTSNLPRGVKFTKKASKQISKQDVQGVDVVFHCAAQVSTFLSVDYPREDFDRNANGTFSVFEALRKYNDVARVVYTSSRSVLGDIAAGKIADESFPYNPSTFYNVHKIYGELLCKIYDGLYGIKSAILRPSNVYGPGQPYWMSGWYNFCLPPGSLVNTELGPRRIEDLRAGEKVLTHLGRYRRVTDVHRRPYEGELVEIRTHFHHAPLSLTPDHPVLVVRCDTVTTDHVRRYGIDLTRTEWAEAGTVNRGDLLVFPVPKVVSANQKLDVAQTVAEFVTPDGKMYGRSRNQFIEFVGREYRVNPVIEVDETMVRIGAMYVTEGCATKTMKQTHFTLSEKEVGYADQLTKDLREVFQLEARLTRRPANHAIDVYINSVPVTKLLARLFGRGAANKKIPAQFTRMPVELRRLFVDWLVKGDGNSRGGKISYTTVSQTLAYQLRDMLVGAGVFPSLEFKAGKEHTIVAGRESTEHEHFTLRWYSDPKRRAKWITDDYVYLPVWKISSRSYKGFVYNLDVEEDHTYTSGYHTVHNCAYWIKLGFERKPLPIYGTGTQVRDYTYVDDIADAFIRAMDNKAALGETFLLATGRAVTLNQLADLVNSITGNGDRKQYLPPRKGDVQYFVGTSEKAGRILGWRPKVSLEDGLKKEAEWVKADIRVKRKLPAPLSP